MLRTPHHNIYGILIRHSLSLQLSIRYSSFSCWILFMYHLGTHVLLTYPHTLHVPMYFSPMYSSSAHILFKSAHVLFQYLKSTLPHILFRRRVPFPTYSSDEEYPPSRTLQVKSTLPHILFRRRVPFRTYSSGA